MQRQPVTSSNLRAVGYDPQTQILEIEFKTGGIYQYTAVPESVYTGLVNAGSKGSYFHANIKGQYNDHKIG
jgi:hypothetical protein